MKLKFLSIISVTVLIIFMVIISSCTMQQGEEESQTSSKQAEKKNEISQTTVEIENKDKSYQTSIKNLPPNNFIAIAGGDCYSLALADDGTVWGTGANHYNRLGIGKDSENYYNNWMQTELNENIIAIACGAHHNLALSSNGTVWAIGSNCNGQLGLGDYKYREEWTKISSLNNIVAIACGNYHSMALDSDGKVWATGYNEYGQLGRGDYEDRNIWTKWEPSYSENKIVAIACGGNHSLAISSIRKNVYVTGCNEYGQLGLGDYKNRNYWTDTDAYNVDAIACGYSHSLYLSSSSSGRRVWATGYNEYGQLGLGDNENRNKWTRTGAYHVDAIACGIDHSLLLSSGKGVWATGANSFGQLGLGDRQIRNKWLRTGIYNIDKIACGGSHSLALSSDGIIWGTGDNNYGQLGLGDSRTHLSFNAHLRADARYFTWYENSGEITITGLSIEKKEQIISLEIPSEIEEMPVTVIGDSAFGDCDSLESIVMPDSIKGIDQGAFFECTKLGAIRLPSSLRYIDRYAFYNCTNLSLSFIPNLIRGIGDSAFENSGIRTMSFAHNVKFIGNSAFKNCPRLQIIYLLTSNPPELGSNVFMGVTPTGIYIRLSGKDAFLQDEDWMDQLLEDNMDIISYR